MCKWNTIYQNLWNATKTVFSEYTEKFQNNDHNLKHKKLEKNDQLKHRARDFSGGPAVKIYLPAHGVWVQSLVRELKSHMLHSQKTKT